ncbi:MAG: hypothetical protein R3282_00765, partial [Rhodothermales bacterium]|nr:hypothetical protein [Rhodothermales bacterium]
YFEEHLKDPRRAAEVAAGWDGDAYALLERDGRHALVWYTVWDSPADADEFVAGYRAAFEARFGIGPEEDLVTLERRARVDRMELGGLAAVRVVEGPADVILETVPKVVIVQ